MKKKILWVSVVALLIIAVVQTKSYFDNQFYAKQTTILQAEIFPFVPPQCKPAYITHSDTFVNLYCQPVTDLSPEGRADLRKNVLSVMDNWNKSSPYNSRDMHVRFTDEPQPSEPTK
mgnify:CR=1 FL=1